MLGDPAGSGGGEVRVVRIAAGPDGEDDPAYPPYSRRPVQVDADYCYYHALLSYDVTLVTEGIERITDSGIRTVDGTEHEST